MIGVPALLRSLLIAASDIVADYEPGGRDELVMALLLAELYGRLREVAPISRQVDRIHEHTMLSDNAKRVLFRDRETQLLLESGMK